jgi:hypothetical protein
MPQPRRTGSLSHTNGSSGQSGSGGSGGSACSTSAVTLSRAEAARAASIRRRAGSSPAARCPIRASSNALNSPSLHSRKRSPGSAWPVILSSSGASPSLPMARVRTLAWGVPLRVPGSQDAGVHHLLHQAVVARQLQHRAVPQQVGAAVAAPQAGEVVAIRQEHHQGRGDGDGLAGACLLLARTLAQAVVDGGDTGADRGDQVRAGQAQRRFQRGLQLCRGDLALLVAARAVRDGPDPQVRPVHEGVLVAGPDGAHVGHGPGGPGHGHGRARVTGGAPSSSGSRHRRGHSVSHGNMLQKPTLAAPKVPSRSCGL